jgi:Kdo2-lipid IVA lauroyltransferase/acyltransferase
MRDNLSRSFPGLDASRREAILGEHVRRLSEVLAEIIYGFRIGADELRARVAIVNPELLQAGQPPRPLILVGAHQGNWEWMLLRISLDLGPQFLALYKPMTHERSERAFHRMRSRFGARLVAAKSVLAELARFREARGIGLLADQVPRTSPEKHWVRFLDQDTAFFMGPELLARALRSQAVQVQMRRLGRGRYALELHPLNEAGEKLPTGTVTERYAAALEKSIVEDPAGWWWSHRRWKLKRPPG